MQSHKNYEMKLAVDFDHGLRSCMGRNDLYARVIEAFMAARADDPARVRQALSTWDLNALQFAAHSVIYSAGAIGAFTLSGLARKIYDCATNQPLIDAIRPLLDSFEHEHRLVMAELLEYVRSIGTVG